MPSPRASLAKLGSETRWARAFESLPSRKSGNASKSISATRKPRTLSPRNSSVSLSCAASDLGASFAYEEWVRARSRRARSRKRYPRASSRCVSWSSRVTGGS